MLFTGRIHRLHRPYISTVRITSLLVVLPVGRVTMTLYFPASTNLTRVRTSVAAVRVARGAPLRSHW